MHKALKHVKSATCQNRVSRTEIAAIHSASRASLETQVLRKAAFFSPLFRWEEALLERWFHLGRLLCWKNLAKSCDDWTGANRLLTKFCCISARTSSWSCLGRVVNPLVLRTRSKCFAIHLRNKQQVLTPSTPTWPRRPWMNVADFRSEICHSRSSLFRCVLS